MLVLTRKVGEEIVLPSHGVTIGVVSVNGRQVRLGVAAPPETSVHRKEVWQRIRQSGEAVDDGHEPAGEPQWQQEVRRRIAARTHGLVFGVQLEAVDGRLIIHGRSRSYYGKQLACAAALELPEAITAPPFQEVELDIEVVTDRRD